MYVTLYATNGNLGSDDVTDVMLEERVLCNVFPMQSVVQDADTGAMRVESGAKVDIFDIDESKLIEVWGAMRHKLGIHCVWIETEGYAGCICEWPAYKQHCAQHGLKPLRCSEYDDETLGSFIEAS